MIKCRNMQKAAPPAWQPWQSCQRAAALIKQYDDGLIENKLRQRERGSQRKLHKFTGRVKQSYHSIYRYHLPFTIENTSLPKHLISLTHTHKQAVSSKRRVQTEATEQQQRGRERERARQRSSGRSSTHKSKQNHMP